MGTLHFLGGDLLKKLKNNKNLMLLLVGRFVSSIGDMMYNLGLTMILYMSTNSITPVAIMFLSRGALRIPIQYLSGVLADNFNRKHIIVATNLISVPIALSLTLINESNLWIGYVAAFLLQALDDVDRCAEVAILPELVEKDQLTEANSLFSVLGKVAFFGSPALAGLLYKTLGVSTVFIFNSISFFVAGAAFMFITYNKRNHQGATGKNIFTSGIEGFKIIKNYRNVIVVFTVASSFALLGLMYEVMKVAVSDITLNVGPDGIIYFSYALALGGLLAPFIVRYLKKYKDVNIYIFSSVTIALSYIVWSSTRNLYLSLGVLSLKGLFGSLQGIYSTTILQKEIPKSHIGRIFSLNKMILTASAMIGIAMSPLLYKLIGIGNTFLIFSLMAIIISLLAFVYIDIQLQD